MARKDTYVCDACGKDPEAAGNRPWLLQVSALRLFLNLKVGQTVNKVLVNAPSGVFQFCDYVCLGVWAGKQQTVEQTALAAASAAAAPKPAA